MVLSTVLPASRCRSRSVSTVRSRRPIGGAASVAGTSVRGAVDPSVRLARSICWPQPAVLPVFEVRRVCSEAQYLECLLEMRGDLGDPGLASSRRGAVGRVHSGGERGERENAPESREFAELYGRSDEKCDGSVADDDVTGE